jgi:hypothetical protein
MCVLPGTVQWSKNPLILPLMAEQQPNLGAVSVIFTFLFQSWDANFVTHCFIGIFLVGPEPAY